MANRKFDTPAAAEAAFYEAFSRMDLDLMAAVWRDDGLALCIHPGSGLRRGKAAVIQSWMEIFTGSAPPGIEYRVIERIATEGLAVHLVEERIWPRDRPPKAANRVLATNVYLRYGRSWYLTEHHASLPLVERGEAASGGHQLH